MWFSDSKLRIFFNTGDTDILKILQLWIAVSFFLLKICSKLIVKDISDCTFANYSKKCSYMLWLAKYLNYAYTHTHLHFWKKKQKNYLASSSHKQKSKWKIYAMNIVLLTLKLPSHNKGSTAMFYKQQPDSEMLTDPGGKKRRNFTPIYYCDI